jgi:heme exporter protein D
MRKLPVLAALTHAIKSTWHNLPFAFNASWPWLLLLIPFNLYFNRGAVDFDPTTTDPVKQVEMAKAVLMFYATSAVSMIIYGSIGVTWHRYILQDEKPDQARRMRLDSVVWRYVGNTILVGIFAVLSILPLALLASIILQIVNAPIEAALPFYSLFALLIALPITYRFSLKLPAIAIGNQNFRFGDAWNASRENMPQLMGLGICVFTLLSLTGLIIGGAQQGVEIVFGNLGTFIFGIARQLLGWVFAVFTITMLTSLYGFFVEKRDF